MLDMRGPARWYDKRNPGRQPSWMPVRVRCSHASAVWLFEQGRYEALVRASRRSYGKIEEGGLVAIDNHPKSRNNERKIGRTRRARGGQRQPEENGIRRAREGERLVHADIATAGGAVRQSEHACKKLRLDMAALVRYGVGKMDHRRRVERGVVAPPPRKTLEVSLGRLSTGPHTPPNLFARLSALFREFVSKNPNCVHPAARSAAKFFFSVHVLPGVFPNTPKMAVSR